VAGRGTPATAAARAAGIRFALHEFRHDPSAESYGLEAASRLGVPPARVLKTLVASLDGGRLAVGIVGVERRLDLKALAAALGAKRAVLAEPEAAQRATGYLVGGISPLGQKRLLPTALDAAALEEPAVFVSGGRRGLEIELDPGDLARLTRAVGAPLSR